MGRKYCPECKEVVVAKAMGDYSQIEYRGIAAKRRRIKHLEEELIKKDVNYAKLQDEFSSMEKEYLAMYEAIHGDNS